MTRRTPADQIRVRLALGLGLPGLPAAAAIDHQRWEKALARRDRLRARRAKAAAAGRDTEGLDRRLAFVDAEIREFPLIPTL